MNQRYGSRVANCNRLLLSRDVTRYRAMSRSDCPKIVPAIGTVGDAGVSRSTLLFQRVSDRLSQRNIFVDDRDGVAVFGERQTNLIDDPALSMIGLLDRGIVDFLE